MRYILGYAVHLAKLSDAPAGRRISLITARPELPVSKSRRRQAPLIVFVFCSILLLLAAFRYPSFHWNLFTGTLRQLDPSWLAAGAGCALLSYFGRALRWKVMMLPDRSQIGHLFAATVIGYSAVVLFGRAGEVVRPVLIARREGSTVAAQAAIWIVERLFDLLLILVLFGVGLAESDSFDVRSGSVLAPIVRVGGGVVTVAAGAASAILYLLARHPETCKGQLLKALSFLPAGALKRVERTLSSFLCGAASISRPGIMASSLVLTVIEWAIVLLAVWCLFQSHPAFRDFGFLEVAVYLGFVSVGNIVQLPGIGGGVQLVSVVVLTELFHQPIELATSLSLLIWAGLTLIVLPIGTPLALLGHLRLSDIRQDMRGIDARAL